LNPTKKVKSFNKTKKTRHHFCLNTQSHLKTALKRREHGIQKSSKKIYQFNFDEKKHHQHRIQETQAKPNSCVAAKENVMPDSRGVASNRGSEAKLLEA